MGSLKLRIGRLEQEAWAAEVALVQGMTDAELAALAGDILPEQRAVLRAMTDAELETLVSAPPGQAERIFERAVVKYGRQYGSPGT